MSAHTTENYDKVAQIPDDNKIECLICGQWYLKPMGHVAQRHGMSAREYKKKFGYPLKKGLVGIKLHKRFVKMGKENPSWRVNLLIKGRDFRFKIGHKLNRAFQWIRKIWSKIMS